MRIREAMATALYGPQGFFRREQPRDHFRTSALASPLFARALARLIAEVDEALGNPDDFTVVDIGAGRGELLTALIAGQRRTTRWVAVEKAGRPEHLDERVQWLTEPPPQVTGVVLACEWLDNIPLDLVEVDDEGLIRYVEVDGVFGEPVDAADGEWLAKWWPIAEPGEVAEIGLTRDDAWNRAVSALHRGLAVAIDYGHLRDERPWTGTLTGFRAGREVAPAYDGSTDITAHVAFDSLGGGVLITQREALHRLGVDGSRPPVALASSDPAGYLSRLNAASEAAELTDPRGLGAHRWLLRPVGLELGFLA